MALHIVPNTHSLILTVHPVSAKLPDMTSLLQTGSGMISAYVGRCRPKSDCLSVHNLLRLAETTTRWPSMAANRDMLDSFKTFVAEWAVGMRYEKVPLEAHATLKFINRARSFAKEFVPWA